MWIHGGSLLYILGGGFKHFVHLYLGKCAKLTIVFFQMGWNQQLVYDIYLCLKMHVAYHYDITLHHITLNCIEFGISTNTLEQRTTMQTCYQWYDTSNGIHRAYINSNIQPYVTFMHTCMHTLYIIRNTCTYMLTYIHTYIRPCMHACMHTCMHTCIHTCIQTYVHTYTHKYT